MKLRTVLFCGDQSRYGRAHLRPVLEHFDVAAVMIGTPQRWATFRAALSGDPSHLHGGSSWAGRVASRWRRLRRRRSPGFIDVPEIVRAAGVPLRHVGDVNDSAFLDELRGLRPDLIVSAAYPQIFGQALLAVPARGAINFHPSLLPRFRGAHPHFWAIATGAETSGVTAHFMTPRIDDGDVIAQHEFPIADLTYSQLYARIEAETPDLVRRVAAFLADPAAEARPQDAAQATQFRNDRDVHRRIFWRTHTAEQVRNLCRTEAAFCFLRGQRVCPLNVSISTANRNLTNGVIVEGGTVVDVELGGGVVVAAADGGCVSFRDVRAPGGRTHAAHQWARRLELHLGELLN